MNRSLSHHHASSSSPPSVPKRPFARRPQRSLPVRAEAQNQRRTCIVHDLSAEIIPYEEAWAWQKAMVEAARRDQQTSGDSQDRLLILQHGPVYTLGTGSTLDNLRFPLDRPPFPLYRTERGGEVTYHGPGQLVAYPILNLRHHSTDLHWYLRSLEESVIKALDAVSGLKGDRVAGRTGVWVGGSKVCALGVRAAGWVTFHGLALNVVNDLWPFNNIVPCGINDAPVTSVQILTAESAPVAKVRGSAPAPRQAWTNDESVLLREYSAALIECIGEEFQLEMLPGGDPREDVELRLGSGSGAASRSESPQLS